MQLVISMYVMFAYSELAVQWALEQSAKDPAAVEKPSATSTEPQEPAAAEKPCPNSTEPQEPAAMEKPCPTSIEPKERVTLDCSLTVE